MPAKRRVHATLERPVTVHRVLGLAILLAIGCTSPKTTPDPAPKPDEPTPTTPLDPPAEPEQPWTDATEGVEATLVLVAKEVAQGRQVLAAYAFSSDPQHRYFGKQPLELGRASRVTKSDMQALFARLESRGMFGLSWWDQPPEGPGELAAGLYVWDGSEQLMVLREGLTEQERATLYACELELRGLTGHKGWNDATEGLAQTLIYVTRIGNREDARPAALVFSSDPENAYFQRTSTEAVTVKRYQRSDYTALEAELTELGLGSLPWREVELGGKIGPERALYVQEAGITKQVVKDAITQEAALRAFSAIERRLIRITMSKQ